MQCKDQTGSLKHFRLLNSSWPWTMVGYLYRILNCQILIKATGEMTSAISSQNKNMRCDLEVDRSVYTIWKILYSDEISIKRIITFAGGNRWKTLDITMRSKAWTYFNSWLLFHQSPSRFQVCQIYNGNIKKKTDHVDHRLG